MLPPKYTNLVRVAGRDKTACEVLLEAEESGRLTKVNWLKQKIMPLFDYAQIDPQLDVTEPTLSTPITLPSIRVGYAGLTPQQRHRMLTWLADPLTSAPNAIRQIYVAYLETDIFEENTRSADAIAELNRLLGSDTWQLDHAASRAMLLGLWYKQDGTAMAKWLNDYQLPSDLAGIAIGHVAMMGHPLTPKLFHFLLHHWAPSTTNINRSLWTNEFLQLRITALAATLGDEPLAYCLAQLSNEEKAAKPWRCTHRDIRISIPQPDLEQILKPILIEAVEGIDSFDETEPLRFASDPSVSNSAETTFEMADDNHNNESEATRWSLVLEFGHSRSEYFDFAIFRARQRPGYTQIMDEDRTLIHRVVFTKAEMRHFWALWEYVQNWSSVQVYVNGTQLEKWKVWPHSQYLR